jgi:hypothetical protein
MDSKLLKPAGMVGMRRKPPNAGKGRVKGVKNKLTRSVKALLEAAFLDAQADNKSAANLKNFREHSPREFIAACSKLIPSEIKGDLTHTHKVASLEVVQAALGIEKKR